MEGGRGGERERAYSWRRLRGIPCGLWVGELKILFGS